MIRYLKLLVLLLRVSLMNEAAYRADFFLRAGWSLVAVAGELTALWIVFANTPSLAGWNVYQVLALLGVFRMVGGAIGMVIAPSMRRIMEDVRNGTLDFLLTKPVNSQFFASLRQIVPWRAADLVIGAVLALFGGWRAGARPETLLLFLPLLAAGIVIVYSIWLVLATTTIWFIRVENIEMVFWNLFEAGRYPMDIYPRLLRRLLTYLVPVAFIITVPAGALAGKTRPWQVLAALALSAASLVTASLFWRYGLRHYRGASA
jgi:ABC-2 type transport system permease protein